MKENIYKIGDLCNIRTGKLDANASSENGKYPFFTCAETPLRIDTFSYDVECVLIAGNGDLNVKYYKGKSDAYQRTYILTLKPEISDVDMLYIYKYFLNYIKYLRQQSIGGIIKYIRLGNLTEAKIQIPSITKQKIIVSELDLLSGVIEKQKTQLEELDKLAQSIFYDMFGDPNTNTHNFPIVKMEELCSLITKGTTPTSLGFSFVEEGINFIKVESFNKDESFNLNNVTHITKECNQALKRSILEENDILVCIAGATCGRLALVPREALPANTNQAFGILRLKDKSKMLTYIYNFLHTSFIKNLVNELKKGVAQPNLTLNHLRNLNILIPPDSIRQEFSAKVEAIEAMKAKVRQSLKEAETLFNERMDYYFN